jgi:hypothetical protein
MRVFIFRNFPTHSVQYKTHDKRGNAFEVREFVVSNPRVSHVSRFESVIPAIALFFTFVRKPDYEEEGLFTVSLRKSHNGLVESLGVYYWHLLGYRMPSETCQCDYDCNVLQLVDLCM